MSDHQRETAFLRHLVGYDDTDAGRELDKKITEIQRDQHCVERAASAAGLCTALAVAAIAYLAILQETFPHTGSEFVIQVICVLGLASLICLVSFLALLVFYRNQLNRLLEQCRGLITKLAELRLGRPEIATGQPSRQEAGDLEGATGVPHRGGFVSLRKLAADSGAGTVQQGDSCL